MQSNYVRLWGSRFFQGLRAPQAGSTSLTAPLVGITAVLVTRSADGGRAYEWGQPERAGPIVVAGSNPRETLPLHAAQDRGDEDLADHGDRVDQRVAEGDTRVGVGTAVRESEDGRLRLRAAE